MRKPTLMFLLLLAVPATGCMVGEVGEPMPAAPTQLVASPAAGGAHLTWKDNWTDEMHFMVMRMMQDGPEAGQMKALATLGENAIQYHDESIESGMTYMYIVAAMNDAGESDSNEVLLAAP